MSNTDLLLNTMSDESESNSPRAVNLSTYQLHEDSKPRNMEGIFNEGNRKPTGLSLTWKDLSVSILFRNERFFGMVKRPYLKKIVENASGAVVPGNLVALMGPSGAGKSTILAALARRSQGGTMIDGDVRLNGRTVDDSIRKMTGYMYQEDFFVTVLTVKEHLRYMARLKMDRRTSRYKREQRITALLEALSLTHLADSRIGGLAANGEKAILSGGEKKRLSFATACLTLPQLLFVDEPTTGLDSFTATRLVSIMKSMVQSTGASLIATIHQPSPEVLNMFSSIILVAEGRVVFSGSKDDGVKFFNECGLKMSDTITEAEFLLECVAPARNQQPGSSSYKKISVRRLTACYEASDYYTKTEEAIQTFREEDIQAPKSFNFKGQFWITQLFWLTIRGMVEMGRNPHVQWIRIGQKMLIALGTGICYFGTLHLDQKGVQGVQGVLFLLVTENVFAPMYAVMAVFPKEYPLFVREYRNGAYKPSAYYLSKIFCLGPGAVLEAFLFTSLLYLLAGLRLELFPYAVTTAFTILCINVATAIGTLFSNAFSTLPIAMTFLLPVEYISMITSGIFLKLSSLPWFTSWLQYISWFMYTYESMSVVQWEGVNNITCPADEALRSACLTNGREVLEHYNFSETHLIRNAVTLVVFYVTFQLLGYQCFLRKVKRYL